MTWKYLHLLAEGHTEEDFANKVIKPHLYGYNVQTFVQLVETKPERHVKIKPKKRLEERSIQPKNETENNLDENNPGKATKGGLTDYRKARQHLVRLMNSQKGLDCFFTTMFDIYHMPSAIYPEKSFPGYTDAMREIKAAKFQNGLEILSAKLKENLAVDVYRVDRLIPYFQLHEFEALIFSDLKKLQNFYPVVCGEIQLMQLQQALFNAGGDPEKINHDHGPADRIKEQLNKNGKKNYQKTIGALVAEDIGLLTLRQKCHFFDLWLTSLENL